jgi:hypothetical protein
MSGMGCAVPVTIIAMGESQGDSFGEKKENSLLRKKHACINQEEA